MTGAPIIGWGRLRAAATPDHCGVTDTGSRGSVLTACRGRWPAAEPWDYVEGRDAERDAQGRKLKRCGACAEVADEQRTLAGLTELRHAPVIETCDFPAFDLTDTDEGPTP